MPDTPPFDPPYITTYDTTNGVQLVETLADGTTRAATPICTSDLQARAKQPSVAAAKGRAGPTPSATKPAPSSRQFPGDRRATLFLDVHFPEKDAVKRLGAKWDAAMRKWYVPHGADTNLFSRWWPEVLKQDAELLGNL
jgi:hypothetical protein